MKVLSLITFCSIFFLTGCKPSIQDNNKTNCVTLIDSIILQKRIVIQLVDNDSLHVSIHDKDMLLNITQFIGKRDSSFVLEKGIFLRNDLTKKVDLIVIDSTLLFTVPYLSVLRREELFAVNLKKDSVAFLTNRSTNKSYSLTSEFGYFIIDTSRKIIQCTQSAKTNDGDFEYTPITFYIFSKNGFDINHSFKLNQTLQIHLINNWLNYSNPSKKFFASCQPFMRSYAV